MAVTLGKLTIIIGAGIVGSVLTKEGRLSDFSDFFSGALKIATKHLQKDKENSRSTGKSQTDTLLAQVNNLRQELQLLASSRSVTIVTGSASGSGTYSVTAIVVVGAVGYGYVWWKGWKLSDMMFVTRRSFSGACTMVGKQVNQVSSSISSAKGYLSSRIDRVDNNLNECLEHTISTKDEVLKLHGELSGFHVDVESVHRAVETLETKLDRIEESQDLATRGVYNLCMFVQSLEQNRNTENIQASPSNSRPSLEQAIPVARSVSLPPLALEPSSPSASIETPKVLRPSTALSTSALKELQGISNVIKASNSRPSTPGAATLEVPNGNPSAREPTSSSSSSGRFRWSLPSMSLLTRSRSTR